MEIDRHWIAYDWFKLIVALILLVVFIFLLLGSPPPVPAASPNLPAYPAASFTWQYDASSRALLDPVGLQRFTLSADGSTWQPVVPAEIQAELPSGYQLVQDATSGWVLRDSDGMLLYTWDMQSIRWSPAPAGEVAVQQPVPSSTPLLTAALTEAPTPDSTEAPTAPPTAVPTAVPTEAPTNPPAETPAATEAPPSEPVQSATSVAGCQPPAPARLVAGKTARILSNLNLRSEPAIGDNILSVNPAGTVLTVLQGPVCIPYQSSAYLWWQVESPNGTTGWSAENYLNGLGYYLLPIP